MNTTYALGLLTLASIGSLMAGPVLAQDDAYYYGGLSWGRARSNLDAAGISRNTLGTGLAITGTGSDRTDNSYKFFGGYQFNRNVGVEAGYFSLGKSAFSATTAPAGTLDGTVRVRGANLDLVGTLPLSENWAALARVGAQYARTQDNFNVSGAATVNDSGPSKRETNYKAGLGLQYAFNPSVMVRGEAERYRVNDAANGHMNVTVYSVGLVFPFGREETRPPRAMAPAYVAPPAPPVSEAPAPVVVAAAPVPAPLPEPVPLRRVTFSAESLFGFDDAEVKPPGMAALDTFSRELEGTTFDTINVEGHTDRLGTQAHNQTLSLQRADAVKAYLVTTGRIDPMKINTVGKSESAPVTHPEDCKGHKANAKLIACLQPDRRVQIDVMGTR